MQFKIPQARTDWPAHKFCTLSARGLLLASVLFGSAAQAQITITSADMFNQVGQYYRAFANNSTNVVNVSSLLGTTGGPQAWDFSTGPQDVTYRFDYLAASNALNASDFTVLGAQLAERKTDEGNTNDQSWLYFTQDPVKGRIDYGFYDPTFSASQPESVFTNALRDFPNAIHYGDTWQGTTIFYSTYSDPTFGDFPDQVTYTSSDKVDAYGIVTLPSIGFLNCLRVHELVEYDIALDLGLGDGWQTAGTQYVLNYYWLAVGHGIAVQITSTSPSDGSEPPDNLPGGAAALLRMFEANHSSSSGPPPPTSIQGFKLTLGQGTALLQWTALPSTNSYRVDYTTNLAAPVVWQPVGSTTANYLMDSDAASTNAPTRYYRVVGLVGSK